MTQPANNGIFTAIRNKKAVLNLNASYRKTVELDTVFLYAIRRSASLSLSTEINAHEGDCDGGDGNGVGGDGGDES